MTKREQAVEEAKTWLRTPFVQNAAVKGAGVDCGRLLVEVYRGIVPVPQFVPRFSRDWHLHTREERFIDLLSKFAREVERGPEPGDITLFQVGRVYGHAGIVIDWPVVIHSYWQSSVEFADANKAPLAGRNCKVFDPFYATERDGE
jgi:cell wall-associated NlpC family hydrolase